MIEINATFDVSDFLVPAAILLAWYLNRASITRPIRDLADTLKKDRDQIGQDMSDLDKRLSDIIQDLKGKT